MHSLVESELHDGESPPSRTISVQRLMTTPFLAYGTTEKLSKFWMPLEEYTKVVLEALKRGETYITAGSTPDNFKRFDTGKLELAENLYKMGKSL